MASSTPPNIVCISFSNTLILHAPNRYAPPTTTEPIKAYNKILFLDTFMGRTIPLRSFLYYNVKLRYSISESTVIFIGISKTRTVRLIIAIPRINRKVRRIFSFTALSQSTPRCASTLRSPGVRHCRAATLPRAIALCLTGFPPSFLRHWRRSAPPLAANENLPLPFSGLLVPLL